MKSKAFIAILIILILVLMGVVVYYVQFKNCPCADGNGKQTTATNANDTGTNAAVVRDLLSKKYGPNAIAKVSVLKSDDLHLRGEFNFAQAQTDLGNVTGGIFLVANLNGRWQLAFDGNGVISCAKVEPYGFPSDMINDCTAE